MRLPPSPVEPVASKGHAIATRPPGPGPARAGVPTRPGRGPAGRRTRLPRSEPAARAWGIAPQAGPFRPIAARAAPASSSTLPQKASGRAGTALAVLHPGRRHLLGPDRGHRGGSRGRARGKGREERRRRRRKKGGTGRTMKGTTLSSIRKIIVPTDFSELSDVAARSAAWLAALDAASIHLLHVIRLPLLHTTYDENIPESVWEKLRQATREQMDRISRDLRDAGVSDVHPIVSEHRQPAEAVAHWARALDADLVVMATHGRTGLKHALLGSVTERIVRSSPIPVLSVKDRVLGEKPIRRLLVATDFSPQAKRAVVLACSFAKRFGAHVDLVHVLNESPDYVAFLSEEVIAFETRAGAMAEEHLAAAGKAIEAEGLPVETHLRKGIPGEVLASEAGRLESDLIVMGTHGFSGFAHLTLGSVAERTLRLAPCPVLTTRATEE
ncbi:MAG TPA: universal stress protein [Deltaproteobacteria bacterium]|nr:universal stress protein [Deltaproteobacteria bacterium]